MPGNDIRKAKDHVALNQKVFVKVISKSEGQMLGLSLLNVDQTDGTDLLPLTKTYQNSL